MTDLRKAAEMALEALIEASGIAALDYNYFKAYENEIAALRQALAQPEQDHGFDRTASHMAGEYVDTAEQEPVAQIYVKNGYWIETRNAETKGLSNGLHNIYTAPVSKREWVSLTDERISHVWHKDLWKSPSPHHEFARAIEAASKELNT